MLALINSICRSSITVIYIYIYIYLYKICYYNILYEHDPLNNTLYY